MRQFHEVEIARAFAVEIIRTSTDVETPENRAINIRLFEMAEKHFGVTEKDINDEIVAMIEEATHP